MSDIKNFVASVKNNGLARTNRYAVMLGGIKWAEPTLIQNTVMYCDQVQLPGTNINTSDIRTYGEIRKTPYERLYDDVNMSFYVDTDMSVKTLFDYWVNQIQDPVTRNWNYYENYTSDITIEVQDIKNKTRYTVRLREAFPKSIGAIQLDYNSKDIMKLSVNFAYKFYEVGGVHKLQDNEIISYPGSVDTSNDALSGLTNRLKNFAIGSAGAYGVSKLPQLASKLPKLKF